jgi:hypothetical protein
MRRYSVWFTSFYLITTIFLLSFSQFEAEDVFISSPVPGQVVQGLVEITGSAAPERFEEYTLSFYQQGSTIKTLFEIESSTKKVESGSLGDWETSTLTDDTYILELRVTLLNGDELIHLVEGIRVRNYSPIETSTPEPEIAPTDLEPVETEESIEEVEITPDTSPPPDLAPNPAEINTKNIQSSIIRGAIIGVSGIMLLAIYRSLKNRD